MLPNVPPKPSAPALLPPNPPGVKLSAEPLLLPPVDVPPNALAKEPEDGPPLPLVSDPATELLPVSVAPNVPDDVPLDDPVPVLPPPKSPPKPDVDPPKEPPKPLPSPKAEPAVPVPEPLFVLPLVPELVTPDPDPVLLPPPIVDPVARYACILDSSEPPSPPPTELSV